MEHKDTVRTKSLLVSVSVLVGDIVLQWVKSISDGYFTCHVLINFS